MPHAKNRHTHTPYTHLNKRSPIATEGSQGMIHPGTCHPEGSYSSGQHSWNESVTSAQATANQIDPKP